MIARIAQCTLAVAIFCSLGANYRTQNFVVIAATPQLAKDLGDAAENYRRQLAIEWLGRELPPWPEPCPIRAKLDRGAGGATSFMFRDRQPFNWTMEIQGSPERMLDSVLPHEVTHTIFATHFGRPLPRWADEGACTTVEHASERQKQERFLLEFLTTNRGIAFNHMFAMKEYPKDILPLYSQGYALARFLIAQGGKQKYVQYVGEGMDRNNWTFTTRKYYGYESLGELQLTWLEWVRQGTPEPVPMEFVNQQTPNAGNVLLASATKQDAPAQSIYAAMPNSPGFAPPQNSVLVAGNRATTEGENSVSRIGSEGWYTQGRDAVQRPQSAATEIAAAQPVTTNSIPQNPSPTSLPPTIPPRRQVLLEWRRTAGENQNPLRETTPQTDWAGAPTGTIRR